MRIRAHRLPHWIVGCTFSLVAIEAYIGPAVVIVWGPRNKWLRILAISVGVWIGIAIAHWLR